MKTDLRISYPNSERVYVAGTIHPSVRVAMRVVRQMPTVTVQNGERVERPNDPVYIYDTSGPYGDANVDIDLDAYIPPSYIKSEFQKLEMYKRVADIENEEEFMDMQEELLDRFGEMPACVNNLLNIAFIKAIARKAYITQVLHRGYEVKFFLYNKANVDINKIPPLLEQYNGALKFVPEANPYFKLDLAWKNKKYKIEPYDFFDKLKKMVEDIQGLLE